MIFPMLMLSFNFEPCAVAKETEFDFWGFIFVMLAAVMSGFRWCMTQILLQVCILSASGFHSIYMIIFYFIPYVLTITSAYIFHGYFVMPCAHPR